MQGRGRRWKGRPPTLHRDLATPTAAVRQTTRRCLPRREASSLRCIVRCACSPEGPVPGASSLRPVGRSSREPPIKVGVLYGLPPLCRYPHSLRRTRCLPLPAEGPETSVSILTMNLIPPVVKTFAWRQTPRTLTKRQAADYAGSCSISLPA
jgi:hypothetical protein